MDKQSKYNHQMDAIMIKRLYIYKKKLSPNEVFKRA